MNATSNTVEKYLRPANCFADTLDRCSTKASRLWGNVHHAIIIFRAMSCLHRILNFQDHTATSFFAHHASRR